MNIVFCPARATVILLAALMLHPGISLSAEGRRPAFGRAHDSAVSQDKGRDGRETADPNRRGNDAAEAKPLRERDTLNERRADKPATAVETVGRDIDLKGKRGEFHGIDALLANIKAQDVSAYKGFGDAAKLKQHWQDHGRDIGAKTESQYEAQAKVFLNGTKGPNTLEKTRQSNGDVIRYDPKTNEFGVKSSDGTIRTYFKPDPSVHRQANNLEYFNAQK
jgi:pyocin large subunit-like protein